MVEFEGSINVIDDIKTDLRTDHLLEPSDEILQINLRKSLQDPQEILHKMDSEDKLSISNVSTSGTGCFPRLSDREGCPDIGQRAYPSKECV